MFDHEKKIVLGSHELRVPALFASYRLGDYPTSGLRKFPWAMTRTEALLINAYDFTRRKYQKQLSSGWNAADDLHFQGKPIIIDSGAYYFTKKSKLSMSPSEVLDIELRTHADVGVALDHPFPPDAKDKARRIATTIHNTEIMARQMAHTPQTMAIMPVIHGHTPAHIHSCIRQLRIIADRYHTPLLDHVGIGSLAPLAQRGDAKLAVDVIHTVRQALPRSQIHCFSMGSALLMHLAFYSGADSVDSQTWMVSAGFKLAQLPGHYVMRMAKREYKGDEHFRQAMDQFRQRLAILADQEGFTAKDWLSGRTVDLTQTGERRRYVSNLIDLNRNEHVHNRACHNLWSFNFEVRQYRKAKCDGLLDEFLQSRLAGTRYGAAFQHARKLHAQARCALSRQLLPVACPPTPRALISSGPVV
jgi:tRNA-guanine family transglycosylase